VPLAKLAVNVHAKADELACFFAVKKLWHKIGFVLIREIRV
jgi:hypothetical protein